MTDEKPARKARRPRRAEVLRVQWPAPHLVRVVLGGEGLRGLDVGAFTAELGDASSLASWPITDHGTQINNLATNAFDNTLLKGQGDAVKVLGNLNSRVNSLFK